MERIGKLNKFLVWQYLDYLGKDRYPSDTGIEDPYGEFSAWVVHEKYIVSILLQNFIHT